jgi:hypothetical protein
MKSIQLVCLIHNHLWARLGWALACVWLVIPNSARADLVGPYAPDANTLYLFHFNEATGAALTPNAGSKGGNLITVTNDNSFSGLAGNLPQVTTLLGYSSYAGFGNAFSATNSDGTFGAAAYDGNATGSTPMMGTACRPPIRLP